MAYSTFQYFLDEVVYLSVNSTLLFTHSTLYTESTFKYFLQ